jgi:hypothetical protein
MKIIIQGIELNLIALWLDVALFEGWNEVTPYVVCWGISKKKKEIINGMAHVITQIFSAQKLIGGRNLKYGIYCLFHNWCDVGNGWTLVVY